MFHIVTEFEQKIAEFFGAKYAVATDCCTHAIELCLRHTGADNVSVPTHTYVSVPMTLIKLGLKWCWRDDCWTDHYQIGNTNIIDAATYWQQDGYVAGSYMCISFQFQKHLSLGRGGVILLDDKSEYTTLKQMSYDGRDLSRPWAEQDIDTVGYHYYMTPETAEHGLAKIETAVVSGNTAWCHKDYPYLPAMTVFNTTLHTKC